MQHRKYECRGDQKPIGVWSGYESKLSHHQIFFEFKLSLVVSCSYLGSFSAFSTLVFTGKSVTKRLWSVEKLIFRLLCNPLCIVWRILRYTINYMKTTTNCLQDLSWTMGRNHTSQILGRVINTSQSMNICDVKVRPLKFSLHKDFWLYLTDLEIPYLFLVKGQLQERAEVLTI